MSMDHDEFVGLQLLPVLMPGQSHEIDQDLTTSFVPTPVAVNVSSPLVPLTLRFDPAGSDVKPNTYCISQPSRGRERRIIAHITIILIPSFGASVMVYQVEVRCLTLFKAINLISSSIIQSIICHLCCDQLLQGDELCPRGFPTVNLSFFFLWLHRSVYCGAIHSSFY